MLHKKIVLLCLIVFSSITALAQEYRSFELRYFTKDANANGNTDFKGPKEYLDLENRIRFLSKYAEYASNFFNDPGFNTLVVEDQEVNDILSRIKPQPLPGVRERLNLDEWKYAAFKSSPGEIKPAYNFSALAEGCNLRDGYLLFTKASNADISIPPQSWRFSFSWKARVAEQGDNFFIFSDGNNISAKIGFTESGDIIYTTSGSRINAAQKYKTGEWYDFKIEFDLAAFKRGKDVGRYNLYINNTKVADYVSMDRVKEKGVGYASNFVSIGSVDKFSIRSSGGLAIDNIWGVSYQLTGRESYPYTINTFIDEDFDPQIEMDGWQNAAYEDSLWKNDKLPIVHGSERHAGEDLYLRKKIHIGDFSKALLYIETLNPGGEVWVNGKLVKAINTRHPREIDLSKYLVRNSTNTLAVKVNHFFLTEEEGEIMPHSSLDFNVGWFAGRMHLDLTGETYIHELFIHTSELKENRAILNFRMPVKHTGSVSFRGRAEIKAYPWFPSESEEAVSISSFPLVIGHGEKNLRGTLEVENPLLWTDKDPNLYKIEAVLYDSNDSIIDDFVLTTGIRTLTQEGGVFHLNGKPYMLNGTQIMGFRSPIEEMMKWVLCPPDEWIIRELMMTRKMNGNLLRIHVHAWEFPAVNINDPRYAEYADQLGMMMIWATPAWIRTGKGWGQIDWEGYPLYMEQVYNHPSIVMWEVANHTQSFYDIRESNLFCEKAFQTIYPLDSSRLISFNSYIKHLKFGNDEGTIDMQGNPVTASYAWTAPMVTRGNQDAVTGYSADWSKLRNWPDDYTRGFLESPERAYFNFEHEESMAQPNWELVKAKPWYMLQSYEWDYDVGTIGRRLRLDEWKESQAWQAFSAWESMKTQRMVDYDGFSWCCLHGGPNTVTYKKPLIDFTGHAKLAWYTNKMVLQPSVAGSANNDVVWGPQDKLEPVIIHWGEKSRADLTVIINDDDGNEMDRKTFRDLELEPGRNIRMLDQMEPELEREGFYFIEYVLKVKE